MESADYQLKALGPVQVVQALHVMVSAGARRACHPQYQHVVALLWAGGAAPACAVLWQCPVLTFLCCSGRSQHAKVVGNTVMQLIANRQRQRAAAGQ